MGVPSRRAAHRPFSDGLSSPSAAGRAPRLNARRDGLDGRRRGGVGVFHLAGSISTIWPMFGIANQLLASYLSAVIAPTAVISERNVRRTDSRLNRRGRASRAVQGPHQRVIALARMTNTQIIIASRS